MTAATRAAQEEGKYAFFLVLAISLIGLSGLLAIVR